VNQDMIIGEGLRIPAAELRWRFDTPGGPGGQHANRAATRAELSFDLAASPSVPDHLKALMLERLGTRIRHGVITVSADESRSQWRNRSMATRRMAALLGDASKRARVRRATRPGLAARQRRLEEKRRRSADKRLRRRPEAE